VRRWKQKRNCRLNNVSAGADFLDTVRTTDLCGALPNRAGDGASYVPCSMYVISVGILHSAELIQTCALHAGGNFRTSTLPK
jgi:hypothetical protein